MEGAHPFIEQIDHLGIQTPRPQQLFDFFHDTLGLPVAFPYSEYAGYHSGSVMLGNCFLEIMRFGHSPQNADEQEARYLILGFLNRAESLARTREMLQRRRVRHSDVIPFFAPEATDDNPVQMWANVYLGGLLGMNLWTRLFFFISRYADTRPSDMESKALSAMFLGLMRRAFRSGMPVLTAYDSHLDEHRAAIGPRRLRQAQGGLLGVRSVAEIEVGASDQDAWRRFLAPLQPDHRARVALGEGPALRLLPSPSPGIGAVVLRVASLVRAREALLAKGLQIQEEDDGLALILPDSGGLTLRLAQD